MARQKRGRQSNSLIPPDQLPPLNNETVNELAQMLDAGQFVEAILIMEAMREEHPREAILAKLLGMAYAEIGELSAAAERWEEATRLDPRDPSLWRLLAGVYQGQGRIAHALRALRRYLEQEEDDDQQEQLESVRDAFEEALDDLAATYGVTRNEADRAALLLEQGLRTMEGGDYLGANRQFRDAARAMPGWTAPLNNQALCQFELGNTDAAIEMSQRVLATNADDAFALAALVRFLTLTGRRAEAAPHADRLWALVQDGLAQQRAGGEVTPQPGLTESLLFEKAAEAFTYLERDDQVIAALEPQPRDSLSDLALIQLGAALANRNRKPAALDLFKALDPHPVAAPLAEALQLNETPPGRRFPALDPAQLFPQKIAERADQELARIAADPPAEEATARQGLMLDFLAHFPTFLPTFYSSLWMGDELASANAAGLLLRVGTPEAIDAVRTFAFGRLGPDETRLHAALLLRREGLVDANRPLLLWQDGRYQEMSPPRFGVTPDTADARPYPPAVAKQMSKALDRRAKGDLDGAARALRQVLSQDPSVVDAEQHLGVLALLQNDDLAAEGHFKRALEIDPGFGLARSALASLRVKQKRFNDARDLLIPLADRTAFRATELASYLFTAAELAGADGDAARARQQLRLLLAYVPSHTPARMRLRELEREEEERKKAQEQQGNAGRGGLLSGLGNIPILGRRN